MKIKATIWTGGNKYKTTVVQFQEVFYQTSEYGIIVKYRYSRRMVKYEN